MLEAEWIGRPSAVKRQFAEQVAHAFVDFGQEGAIGQFQYTRRILLVDRPHQCTAMLAGWSIEHGQQSEGTVRVEYLPCHVLMRLAVVQAGDHGAVAVIPARHLEPCLIAAGRSPAFGTNHQGCFEYAAITQGGRHAELAPFA